MMRLPHFRFHSPATVAEAAQHLAADGPGAMLLSGGTDLLPNMKRRHQMPATLISLRQVAELRQVTRDNGSLRLGAGLTLTQIVRDPRVREMHTGLWQAAAQVATPHLRNMGTLGGNICLDTRCNYYNQNYEWRKAIDFCMKKDGEICWVAPGSSRCLAVSSTDTAPALISLGARVRLVSTSGSRDLDLTDLYANDGIHYLTRRPDEILTEVVLDAGGAWRSTYWKLRRRGAFDFPVLSVAAAVRLGKENVVEDARIVLGAVASRPLVATEAAEQLRGGALDDAAIDAAATMAARVAKPMDNTDFLLHWRKRTARELTLQALRELRGDDVREARRRLDRNSESSL